MIFNMLLRQNRSILFRLAMLLIIALVLAGCRERWVSSPEGTATSYVQKAGILVYAPRSARVQKVVFDTADNQLIQEPDTPFRTFFNAHAADFSRGNLEYAKTTILGDIVNLVENREFIREMIVETVARHKTRAIRSQSDKAIVKQQALSAIEALEETAAVVELQRQDLQPLIEKANDAVKKYRAASAFYEIKGPQNTSGDNDSETGNTQPQSAQDQASPRPVERVLRFQSDLSILSFGTLPVRKPKVDEDPVVTLWKKLETFIDQVHQGAGNNKISELRDHVRKLSQQLRTLVKAFPGETGSKSAAINQTDNNASLLVNALFNALNEAKYPDMRPNEIDAVLGQFLPDDKFGKASSVKGNNTTKREETWQRLVINSQAGKDLKEDLLLTLKEQRYFRAVIDKAIDKRRNLFKGATALTAPLGSAQDTVASFLSNNIGTRYLADLKNGKGSLWTAFLNRENREQTTADGGSLIAPGTTRVMTDVELASFGRELRAELLAAIENGTTLRDSITNATKSRSQYLRATTSGDNATDAAARADLWKSKLLAEQRSLDAFDKFKAAAANLKTKADTNRNLPATASSEKAKFEKTVSDKEPSFTAATGATGDLKLGYEALAESKTDAITSGDGAVSDIVTDAKNFPMYDIVKAMAELAKDANPCAQDTPDCPRNEVHVQNLVFEIQQMLQVFETDLSNVASDQATLTAFEGKVSSYQTSTASTNPKLSDETALEIMNFPGKLKTTSSSVTTSAGNAHQKLTAYATKFKTYFTDPAPAHVNREQIYALADHLETRADTFKSKTDSAAAKLNQKTQIASLKTDMQSVRDAYRALVSAQAAQSPASASFQIAKTDYESKKGSATQPNADSLYGVITTLVGEINPVMGEHDRLSDAMLSEIFKRIDLKLREVTAGTAALTDDLSALLNEGLKIARPRNITMSRKQFIDAFVATFNGYESLIASDNAILGSFLEVADIPFSSPDNRLAGAASLPKAVFELCSKSDNTNPAGCGTTLDIGKFVPAVRKLMDAPEIALLFGPGAGSNQYINAFKLELYNAFKHRVAEAVRAERKADYDYWWMTFHPKAVPLGENSADGQSVIEISFPRSATPQEQYHRWIQDRIDLKPANPNKKKDADSKESEDDPNWELMLQAATAVLNDFLIVLDTSNLTDKYPGIRSTIVDAINKFASPIENQDKDYERNYNNGIGVLIEEQERVREQEKPKEAEIMREVLEGGVDIPGFEANKIRKAVESINAKLEVLRPVPQIQIADELTIALEQIRSDNKDLYDAFDTYTSDLLEAREVLAEKRPWEKYYVSFKNSAEKSRKPDETDIADDQRKKSFSKVSGDEDALSNERQIRRDIRSQVRTDIAWDRFGIKHVLFAVSSAAETGITLPYKIELYTQAYFDGSRRFVDPVPTSEVKTARFVFANLPLTRDRQDIINSGKFVVPFSETAQDISVKRLLHLSGVNLAKLSEITKPETAPFFKDKDEFSSYHCNLSDPAEEPEGIVAAPTTGVKSAQIDDPTPPSPNSQDRDAEHKNCVRITDKLLDWLGHTTQVDDVAEGMNATKSSDQGEVVSLNVARQKVVRSLAGGLEYRAGAQTSRYLQDPRLWLWESRLQALREDLRFILVSLFQTSYPGVPDPTRIRDEFSKNDGRLRTLVYEWLRDLWLESARIHQINSGGVPNAETVSRAKVLINLHLDRHPYISLPSREQLISKLSKETNIYEWIRIVTRDQKIMDALSKNLLNALYAPLWDALSRLEKIERQPVAYDDLRRTDFERFRHWSKPKVQPGVQIIDLLPASRDDLVSTSINEGGIVARLAAQADASAAYDLNKLRMATEFVDKTSEIVRSLTESEEQKTELDEQNLSQSVSEHQRVEDARRMANVSKISDSLSSFGYNLGARAQASVYARAKAAVAYSKRREYLDAAITASGRGDNFAKWIVRKSDLRSELAETDSEDLVAAAHNGYPNGDQPFHLLVKIPHGSVQIDWDGKPYILFNSSYAATGRKSWYKTAGFPGLIAKAPLALINPEWWNSVEEKLLATTYPFKWDVQNPEEQIQLISVPNTLGGRLYLDDTDKVKFSDIRALVEAESAFIKATRSAQTGELKKLMGDISGETQQFREGVRTRLKEERDYIREQREKRESTNPPN